MRNVIARAALGVCLFSAGVVVAADLTPEEQILTRQAGYTFMGWNMSKIKASVESDFDQKKIEAAANAIKGIAHSGMGALYGPGTDRDVGAAKTRAKPELFTDQEGVGKVAREFVAATDRMAEAAAGGDQAAIKQAFGALGQACKSCHEKYRADD